ncbi:MAG: ABC transporter permease [Lachnospiraceae bacterium]|nr:MAG: ABC transporter permease [Lachnospiraceae bacterium]
MFKSYLLIQIKRLFRVLPMALLFNFLTIAGICGIFALKIGTTSKSQSRIGVGIVGSIENKYMKLGVEMLNNMDASRFSIKFINMDETAAKKSLKAGEIIGYFKIDKDFIEALEKGENRPVEYISSGAGMISALSKEVASVFSTLLVNSERAIYATDNYLIDHPQVYNRERANTEFNIELLKNVMSRGRIYDVKSIDTVSGLSDADNYICGMSVLFMMLTGLGLGGLLCEKNESLLRVLKSRGLSYGDSLIADMFVISLYIILTVLIFTGGMALTGAILPWNHNFVNLFEYCKDIVFLSVMFASMHLFIYEIIYKRVVAVLAELLLSISLGYIGGCIYPISFFPDIIRKLSIFLPSGAGIQVLSDGMGYSVDIFCFIIILVYSILFIGGVYALRNKR